MTADDTRDIVIELRAEVALLKEAVTTLMTAVKTLEKAQTIDSTQKRMLVWWGAAVLAAAGGMGAVVAKLAGWVTFAVTK